ncbi:MAG: hypothetical protein Q7U53_10555 [Anaerolineaceae bacterium]|nr:hypothetical protein [Anaerolineaceae bacterium]
MKEFFQEIRIRVFHHRGQGINYGDNRQKQLSALVIEMKINEENSILNKKHRR